MFARIRTCLLGQSQNPLDKRHRRSMALIALLAWVGLGADGLSSACYGPALGFLALGAFHHLALYLALLTCVTVFIIALGYNQVIALFPNGGGGYKVANELLGPLAGVISGSALIVDYVLTIAISVTAGTHALLSLFSPHWLLHAVVIEIMMIAVLILLNLRGMKESIRFLLPVFLGFFVSHLCIIVYGIAVHGSELPSMLHATVKETHEAIHRLGWVTVAGFLLRAYSLGSGTYTGLEAVSNNVDMLAEPRVKTGKWTMLYMALSLSLMAGGMIVLYLLWHVEAQPGLTLNAVTFTAILGGHGVGHLGVVVLMAFEAGLLFVGANTGLLGGPAVMSNMAQDQWVPERFATLSSRLVKQNGVVFFGLMAIVAIIATGGHVEQLVIFYAINVFVAFAVSLLGLTVYWYRERKREVHWLRRLLLALSGCVICSFILVNTILSKLDLGSVIAIVLTITMVGLCYLIKRYYTRFEELKRELDRTLAVSVKASRHDVPLMDATKPAAVFLVEGLGSTLHTILWVERMFPRHFTNYVFINYGWVDTGSFGSESALNRLQKNTDRANQYLTRFAQSHGKATRSFTHFGVNPIEEIKGMVSQVNAEFNNSVCFSARYVYKQESFFARLCQYDFSLLVQKQLQSIGTKMLIVPLTLSK